MPVALEIEVEVSKKADQWALFLNANRYINQQEKPDALIINLCSVTFIEPHHVVSLACLIEEYFLSDTEIKFSVCENRSIKYLRELEFFNYWKKGFDRGKHRKTKVGTALCLWKVNAEMVHSYVVYAQRYFQKNFFSGKDLQPLNTALAETFNNILDHAKSQAGGYVFTQYYPQKHLIIISVCDFGKGIADKINEYLQAEENRTIASDSALLLAFKKGFSTKSTPHNRGFGLNTVSSLAKSMRSTLYFISNDAFVGQQITGTLVKGRMENSFPGTQILIRLDTRHLRPLAEEEIIEEENYL